jgi:hypothetical protein
MCLPVKPFAVEKEWEHAGLKCAVVLARENEHRCGYVRVPPGHPCHGIDYNVPDVSVHGGLTFGAIEPCEHEDGKGYWFGFDCAHSGDVSYAPGFAPSWRGPDSGHYWELGEVADETEQLAEQLAKLQPGGSHE